MVSLLTAVLELSYTSKLQLPKPVVVLIYTALVILIFLISYFTLQGLCNAFIAILDLSSALCIGLLTISRIKD